jgi:hypothetical protein
MMPPSKKPRESTDDPPARPRRGRPSMGIRDGYKRIEIALPPAVYEAVARLSDRQSLATGKSVRRVDIIRQAVIAYLQTHLPEAGL